MLHAVALNSQFEVDSELSKMLSFLTWSLSWVLNLGTAVLLQLNKLKIKTGIILK